MNKFLSAVRDFIFFILPVCVSRFLKKFFYDGKNVFCPICGGSYKRFSDSMGRPGAKCPVCESKERHRFLWLYLKNKTGIFSGGQKISLLHFAPEAKIQDILRSWSNIYYVSADIESDLAMLKMDITDIIFKDDCFDLILCSHILEHIVDDKKAMKELHRVLKPNGKMLLQIPVCGDKTFEDFCVISEKDREAVFGQKDHVRIYGSDIIDRLKESGFSLRIEYVKDLDDSTIQKFGLKRDENLYICEKSPVV